MNDRNAFLHGQTAPIRDDAPAPEQGWRGEKAADEPAEGEHRERRIEGVSAPVEEVSGTAYAEARGAGSAPEGQGGGEDRSMPAEGQKGAARPDGVNDLGMGGDSPGGESAGAPYPYGHRKTDNDPGSLMGHGGQTEINYHGPGHLGKDEVRDDDNRNGVAEDD